MLMMQVAAARNGHADVVSTLLDAGAAVDAQCGMALIRAASGGHMDVVRMLVRGAA